MKKKILFVLIILLAIFLRVFEINKFPPSMYWEEVALGYDAYAILKTGADHHGNFLPLVAFESFGDWKPSLYFYSILPFIKILGLNNLAVKLPAVLSGIAIVVGIGMLAHQLVDKKRAINFSLLAMFIAAINPWAIQFSRSAWEVNLATALILWAVILFLKLIRINFKNSFKQWALLLSSVLLLSLSMYAYHATRIIAPFLGLGLIILWLFDKKNLYINFKNNFIKILIAGVLALVLISPIILSFNNSKTNQRFKETSIFYNLDLIKESNSRVEASDNKLLAKILYHRYVLFSREITKNIFSYFDINFLFLSGDQNPRHSIQYFGTFCHIEFIFLLFGIYYLFKNQNKYYVFLVYWLIIGLLPAAISKTNPHALRILPTLPVWILVISLGIRQFLLSTKSLFKGKKNKQLILRLLIILIGLAYLLEFAAFWRYYSRVYPTRWGTEWQYGYQELMIKINELKILNSNKQLYISREMGRPAMYYWFYTKTDPGVVQAAEENAKKDQGEFLEFENIKFENPPNQIREPVIAATSLDFKNNYCEEENNNCQEISNIYGLNQEIIWVIYEVN